MKIQRLNSTLLTPRDCEQICALLRVVGRGEEVSIHDLRTVTNRSAVFVARAEQDDDRIVGLLTYTKAYKLTGVLGRVSELYVLSGHLSRDIVRALLQAVIAEARTDRVVALDRYRLLGDDSVHQVFLDLGFRGPDQGVFYRLEL